MIAAITLATVLSIYDGDTFTVKARIWVDQDVETSVRLFGVDSPEKGYRAHCEQERALAERAMQRVAALIAGKTVALLDVDHDKYGGRILARVLLPDGRDLADLLVSEGLAKPYRGEGPKPEWCAA